MTLNGAAQAIRAFASVSRYYPQIVRYYLFVKDMQKLDSTPLAKARRGDKIILGTLRNGQDVVVEVGDCLAMLTVGQIREPMFALVGAKLAESGAPVATAIFDPNNLQQGPAGLVLMSAQKLGARGGQLRPLHAEMLKDTVTLIVYEDARKAGSFGENQVLTIDGRELLRFASLGTEEGHAALKEFTLRAGAKRKMKGLVVDEEEDDM
jgi:hypothetical protein